MAWLSGYTYRKSITLSRASGAVANYQMKLLVGESAGATGEDVDCGGKIQSGFHDLAFTTSDGTTPLKYWIESITGISQNQLATIWIKFDSIDTGATTFYMYYGSSTLPDPIDVPTTCQWKRYPSNPVLPVGAAGQWDDLWAQINTIWKEGSTYYAYYHGKKSTTEWQIGLATSTDGITWTKNGGNPILTFGASGEWDDKIVTFPMVWKEGSVWYMMYSGVKASNSACGIGLATSSDGITWNKNVSWTNPVYTSGAAWDAGWIAPGQVMLKEGSTYYMYYSGNTATPYGQSVNLQIGLATSTDLITWTKSANNPILTPGTTSQWDSSVDSPCVVKFGSTYYMWFQGTSYDGGNFNLSYIGMASSAVKDSGWSKVAGNPVLGTGGGTGWDKSWSEVPVLVNFGTEWRMYYSGNNTTTPKIQGGFATYAKKGVGADVFITFDDFERIPFAAVGGNWTVDTSTPIISLAQSYGGARSCKLPSTSDMRIPVTASNNIAIGYRSYKPADGTINISQGDGTHYWPVRQLSTEHVDYYSGVAWVDLGLFITINTWQKLEIADIVMGTSEDIWVNDAKIGNNLAVDYAYNGYANQVRIVAGGDTVYMDNFIVRNYRTTEPAWGSWGAEEELTNISIDASPIITTLSLVQSTINIGEAPQKFGWKVYEGQGPWIFNKGVWSANEKFPAAHADKPEYNEGDHIATYANAVWLMTEGTNEPITPTHKPCGYWTKNYVPPPPHGMALQYYQPWEMVKDGNDFYLCGWQNDGIDYKAYVEKRSLPWLYNQESVGITNFSVSNTNLEFFQDVIVDSNYVYTVGRAYNSSTGKTNGIVQRRSKTNLTVVDWTYWLVNGTNNTSMSSLTQDDTYLYIRGLKILQDAGPSAIIKLTKAGAFVSSYDLSLVNGVWGAIILHSDDYLYLAGEYSGYLAMEKLHKNFTLYTGAYSGASGFRKNTIIGTNVVGAGSTWDGGKLVTQSRPLSDITVVNWTRTQDYVVGQVDELYDITNDGTYLYVSGRYYNVGIGKYVALYQCIALDGASVIWTKEADTNKTGYHGGCIIVGSDFWVCGYENASPWGSWMEKRSKTDGTVQESWVLED